MGGRYSSKSNSIAPGGAAAPSIAASAGGGRGVLVLVLLVLVAVVIGHQRLLLGRPATQTPVCWRGDARMPG